MYGPDVSTRDVLLSGTVRPPVVAMPFMRALERGGSARPSVDTVARTRTMRVLEADAESQLHALGVLMPVCHQSRPERGRCDRSGSLPSRTNRILERQLHSQRPMRANGCADRAVESPRSRRLERTPGGRDLGVGQLRTAHGKTRLRV